MNEASVVFVVMGSQASQLPGSAAFEFGRVKVTMSDVAARHVVVGALQNPCKALRSSALQQRIDDCSDQAGKTLVLKLELLAGAALGSRCSRRRGRDRAECSDRIVRRSKTCAAFYKLQLLLRLSPAPDRGRSFEQ